MAVVDQVLGQVYVHGLRPYIRDEEAEQRGAGAQSQGQGRDRLQVGGYLDKQSSRSLILSSLFQSVSSS